jgi:hypothetical protein
VVLDGNELAAIFKDHGINLADSEIDSTLSILNNQRAFTINNYYTVYLFVLHR